MLLPFFDSIRDLKAARIPEIPIPDLTADPDATFVFDDVSHTATAQLRQQLYTGQSRRFPLYRHRHRHRHPSL
jgi:hypothetical protein